MIARALRADERWSRVLQSADEGAGAQPATRSARVVSSFEHALNLEFADDIEDLWTVTTLRKAVSPNGLVCSARYLPRMEAGEVITISNWILHHERIAVDTRSCMFFDCEVQPFPRDLAPVITDGAVREALVLWEETARPGSFILNSPTEYELRVRHCLVEATEKLSEATCRRDANEIKESVARLVGLGTGLTPSGDDLLVGVLAVIAHAPQLSGIKKPFYESVRNTLHDTTDVSRQYLSAAIGGRFQDDVARAARTMLAPSANNRHEAVSALLTLGSTSGSDTLLGIVCGLAALSSTPLTLSMLKKE